MCASLEIAVRGDVSGGLKPMHNAFATNFTRRARSCFGRQEGAFGALGEGGSLGYADPEEGIAYAHVTGFIGLSTALVGCRFQTASVQGRSPFSSFTRVGRPIRSRIVKKGFGSSSSTLTMVPVSHVPSAISMAAATGGTPAV